VSAVFFSEPTVDSLCAAIARLSRRQWDDVAIRQNAGRFSPRNFRNGIIREVTRLLEAPSASASGAPGA